jgi:hypothetical protein
VTWFDDPGDRELLKLIPLLRNLAKVQDVRPYIKKMVRTNKINYTRLQRVFRDTGRESDNLDDKKSQSFRIDKSADNLDSRSKRPKSISQVRGKVETKNQSIKYQVKPFAVKKQVEEFEICDQCTTKTSDKEISKILILKSNSKKLKHSFVNIDNINKKILPKKKKTKKASKVKSKNTKDRTLSKYREPTTINHESLVETRSRMHEKADTMRKSIPMFDEYDNVETIKQDETSKLASFAHNLRRTYLKSGSNSKTALGFNDFISKASKKYEDLDRRFKF